MRGAILLALGTLACATPAPTIEYMTCNAWDGSSSARRIVLQDYAQPDFICGERICTDEHGACWFGCPDDRLPEFCHD